MRTFILWVTHLFCWWIHAVESSWLEESDPRGHPTTLSFLSITRETSMPGVRSQTFCRSSAEQQPLSEGAWLAQAYFCLTLAMGTLQPLPEHQHPPVPGGPESQTISLTGCGDWKGHEGWVGIRGMFHPDTTMSLPVHNSNSEVK